MSLQPLQRRIRRSDSDEFTSGWTYVVEGHWDGAWQVICLHDTYRGAYRCGGVRHGDVES